MATKSIGLTSWKLGAIAVDGDMGTTLTQVGATVQDSAAITTETGTTSDFNIEESDSAFYSIESTPGRVVLALSTYDVDLDTMARFWGGTVVTGPPKTWDMPDTLPVIERSLEINTRDGWKLQIPRAAITVRMQWNLKKTALAQLDIEAVVLQPTKAGVKRIKFTQP
jgi:hypothetical protein